MRMSAVVPIGVIVALVAVLSAAHRADELALEAERQLFARALAGRGQRLLREIEALASMENSKRRILGNFDPESVHASVSSRLQSFYDHDFVFIVDPTDRIIYASPDRRSADPAWPLSVHSQLHEVLDIVRGRIRPETAASDRGAGSGSRPPRAVQVQAFLGTPAMVGAVPVIERGSVFADRETAAPVIISVKLIDIAMLADIASRLQLRHLRKIDSPPALAADYLFNLTNREGNSVAQFAWVATRPGAEVVHRVLPFIGIALAGFVLLAAMIFGHMRSTAAAIAAAEKRLRHLALHDPLCGLPNRMFFGERLEAAIDKVRQGNSTGAVFYIDLDHFKEVNDTLGHPVGDDLLRGVAQRLARTVRDGDLVTRVGGDEFAVIIPDGLDHGTLQAMAARMIAAICSPYSIADQSIVIGASIGIVVINSYVRGAADVMRHADLALYRAKNEGRNRACIYDTAMDADLVKRKLLEHDLRDAIENGGLHVLYQPIVNASGETVVGVEALCRWTHPERGEIPPSEFIPVAEHSGLIIALGEQVLRQACEDGKAWPELTVAVNVSALQFRRPDLVDVVERILSAADFDPRRLELEVTESTVLGNVDTVELAMFRLKALGVRLALDDFGTGYSSLLYLRRFPFDKLKIDSSFVRNIERAADAAAIVHAVASLGRGLGMKVTAEGVETPDQQLFLRAAGIHCMQGYRFGRPCPAADITARLANLGSSRLDHGDGLALAG
jgi:diguanylate cyclase